MMTYTNEITGIGPYEFKLLQVREDGAFCERFYQYRSSAEQAGEVWQASVYRAHEYRGVYI